MKSETGSGGGVVGEAVRALDPVTMGGLDRGEVGATLDAIGAAIVIVDRADPFGAPRGSVVQHGSAPTWTRRRDRRRRRPLAPRGTVAIAVTVALLALGGAAYAGVRVFVNANTGKQLHGWERKTAGPGDVIDSSGTNFDQVLENVSADIPFPKGYETWRTWQLTQVRMLTTCPPGSAKGCKIEMPASQVRERVATGAFCAWVADWKAAKRSGDTASATEAAAMIKQAPSWKAVVAVERYLPGGLGWFGWKRYRAAVAHDDLHAVDRLNANSGCARTAPPAGSHGGTVIPGLGESR